VGRGGWEYQKEYVDGSDPGIGLTYIQNRYYDSHAGRFMSLDPIRFAGGLNLYEYCGGNPVGLVDPEGRRGRSIWDDDGSAEYDRLFTTSMSTRDPDGVRTAGRFFQSTFGAMPGVGGLVHLGMAGLGEDFAGCKLGNRERFFAGAVGILSIASIGGGGGAPARVTQNRIRGDAARDSLAHWLGKQGYTVYTEQYFRTPFGGRFIDIDVWLGVINLGGIEVKTGNSRYRRLQRVKDLWLLMFRDYPVAVVRFP
jgi:RHS repeat-associated protein